MKWLINLLTVVAVAFLYSLVVSPITHAADASWENGSILYGDTTFQGPVTSNGDSSRGLLLAQGVKYYYSDASGKRSIIYFDGNQDPAQATKANYVEYNFTPPDTYSQPTSPKQISLSQQGAADGTNDKEQTSCAVNGIGYILCPIMGFISDGMDWVFTQIQGFMEINPLSTNKDSSLFKAWGLMRSFANIAFVGAFIVFIYSYLTGLGVNQHDVRKMIPRLIIAAVVVNASYILCAIAVDLSNVAGASLQDLFLSIRNQLASSTGQNQMDGISWSAMTAYILSGGTIAAAGLIHLSAVGSGIVYLLVPVLTVAAVAIIVTIAVLAARQALIVILIIISPIAFVAFALPGTQKYFDKWKDLFQTMLLLYPIFSVLFGGAQLAGYLIAQNAQRPEVMILAMFVQVAPLIITPLLIKFSGGLLGKFAGMINNPARGPLDKAKNWSREKADLAKGERIDRGARGTALARRFALNKVHDAERKKKHETGLRSRYAESSRGRQSVIEQSIANNQLARAEKLNESAFEELKRTDPKVRMESVQLKIADMELNVNKAKMEAYLKELESKDGAEHYALGGAQVAKRLGGAALGGDAVAKSSLASRMNSLAHEGHITASALQFAQEQEKLEFSDSIVKGPGADAVQSAAAGITGDKGKAMAAARAVQEMRSDFGKNSAAMKEMMDHFKVTGSETERMADVNNTTDIVKVSEDGKTKFTFKAGDMYTIDAAIDSLYEKKGNYASMKDLVIKSGQSDHENYLTTIVSGVSSGMLKKAPWLGGKNIDIITQGKIKTEQDLTNMVRGTIADGKFKAEWLATGDAVGLNDIAAIVNDSMNHSGLNAKQSAKYTARVENMRKMARDTLANKNLEGSLTDEARTQLGMIAGDVSFKRSL